VAAVTGARDGARNQTPPASTATLSPVSIVAVVVVLPVVALIVVLALVGMPLVVAIVVPLVAGAAGAAYLLTSSDKATVGALVLRPATEAGQPRLYNMVDGLCDSHGFRRPNLFVIDDEARNSLVFGRRSDAASLAITSGYLDALSRIGLEGLLARELARTNSVSLPAATVAVSVGRVLPGGLHRGLVRRVLGAQRLQIDDFDAVGYTRYPPGLAEALATQAAGRVDVRGAVPRSAHLWVASPVAPGATPDTDLGESASLDIRVDALREL
jgi:heat shock protein HtpX